MMHPKRLTQSDIKIVYVRCMGGELAAAASLQPKVAPLGLSAHKVVFDIARATSEWKGTKVTCKLTVQNHQAKIEVVPSAASLISRELNEVDHDRTSGRNCRHSGNMSVAQVINVARIMRPRSMAKKLEGTVKEILGTCQSVGCTIDGQHPHDVIEKIRSGIIKIPVD